MSAKNGFKWKEILLGICALAVLAIIFIIQALFAVSVTPVEPGTAPEFVGKYIEEKRAEQETGQPEAIEEAQILPDTEVEQDVAITLAIGDSPDYRSIANGVVFQGEPHEALFDLLSDPDPAIRIAAAHAVAKTMPHSSGAWETHQDFWENVGDDIEIVRNALYEALVDSVNEEDGFNWIPYTIAWMPGQDEETIEVLAWTANNHKYPLMRKTSLFHVVTLDPRSETTTQLLKQRANDPSFKVRFDVLEHRITRWMK